MSTDDQMLYNFPSMERVLISKISLNGGLNAHFLASTPNLNYFVIHSKIRSVGPNNADGCTRRVSYNPFSLNSFVYSNSYNGCVYLPYKYNGAAIKNTNATRITFKKVIIPDNEYVTKIPSYFMYGCEYVGSLVIPEHITTIEASAFNYCKSLQEIHFRSTIPPAVANSNAFSGIPTTCIIYVPEEALTDYRQATNYPDPSVYTYMIE